MLRYYVKGMVRDDVTFSSMVNWMTPKIITEEETANDLNNGNIPFKSNSHTGSYILIFKYC